jgi:hypothetical protein
MITAVVKSTLPFPVTAQLSELMSFKEVVKILSTLGMEPWEGTRAPAFHWACHPAVKIATGLGESERARPAILGVEHVRQLREKASQLGL